MDATLIIHELTLAEGLPREALKAASAQRGEMVPVFIKEIEDHLALEPAARAEPTPLFFIFHLLGEWQEKSAWNIRWAKFYTKPRAGSVTQGSHRMGRGLRSSITRTRATTAGRWRS